MNKIKTLVMLAVLFVVGCGGSPVTAPKFEYDKTTLIVKNKEIQVGPESFTDYGPCRNTTVFKKTAIIVDVDGNEHRFNIIGDNLTEFNKLLNGKKCIVYSCNGNLSKVEEVP
jgi:hypothetical protein